MTAESKMRKVAKRLHWGRGGGFLKARVAGIKRLDFFNGSQRLKEKRETLKRINDEN
jgi:hypothetical protein